MRPHISVHSVTQAFFSHDQRLQLSAACVICYATRAFMSPLHTSYSKYYGDILRSPLSLIFFCLWFVLIASMLAATWIEIEPYEYVVLQARGATCARGFPTRSCASEGLYLWKRGVG